MGLASLSNLHVTSKTNASSGSNATGKRVTFGSATIAILKIFVLYSGGKLILQCRATVANFCNRVSGDFLRECQYQTPNAKYICHTHARQAP